MGGFVITNFILLTILTCSIIIPKTGTLKGMETNTCGISYEEHYVRKDIIKELTPYGYHDKRNNKWIYNIMYCKINGKLDVEQTCSDIINKLKGGLK